jgi:hypothetical protein
MRLGMDPLAGGGILVFGQGEFEPGLEEPLQMALLQDPLRTALLQWMEECADPTQAKKLELSDRKFSFPSSQ